MKKILVFLLALAIAGGAAALDLGNGFHTSGQVKSGFQVLTQDTDAYVEGGEDPRPDDTTIYHYNRDAGQTFRVRWNLGWTGENSGIEFRVQDNAAFGNSPAFELGYAYGWVNLFDGKAKVSTGKIDSTAWGIAKTVQVTDANTYKDNSGTGVRVEFIPVTGFNLGFYLPLKYNSDLQIPKDALLSTAFGVLYDGNAAETVPLKATAVLKLNPETKKESGGKEYTNQPLFFELGADYKVNDMITAALNFTMQTGDVGGLWFGPRVNVATGGLSAYVKAGIGLYNGKQPKDGSPFLYNDNGDFACDLAYVKNVEVKVNEDTGEVTIESLAVSPEFGISYQLTPVFKPEFYVGSDNILWMDMKGLWVSPRLTMKVNDNISFQLYDTISYLGSSEKRYTLDKGSPNAVTEGIENRFGVDVNWTW